jgi:hypothetical protein
MNKDKYGSERAIQTPAQERVWTGFAQKSHPRVVLCDFVDRFVVKLKAIHELTRTNTKTGATQGLICSSFSDFLWKWSTNFV